MTNNEHIQQFLSEGITEARKRNFHLLEDSYCAVHLAKKCAELQAQQSRLAPYHEARNLQQWMWEKPVLARDALAHLHIEQLAELAANPTLFGYYILGQLHEIMTDNEEPDQKVEDLHDPVNGYRLDELGVG
ncbi:hypothetical protein Nhal_0966 [Nitrosococcus halophilus Nc 4]|uniref:Uncharacterized protein n=1 Tax=Nitrosococcus halophilus (strain Nc4) TaxID=472759 RepID=D5BYF6_NITHN|nr:hypothetical protein [Nitrosococcus halophilus]ADE14139.1 hypothetical protein Nhal_0966 [Nitrosococcus halophilus Nc 4]